MPLAWPSGFVKLPDPHRPAGQRTTMTTAASKICIACGTDCSDTPRTKDLQGRYTCKACDARRTAGQAGGAQPLAVQRPAAPPVKGSRPAPAPAPEPEDDAGLLGSLVESMGGAACVSCGSQIPQGAAICT